MGLPNWRRWVAYRGGRLERALGDPDGLGGDPRARALEGLHRDREPLSLRTQAVGRPGRGRPSKASSAVGEPRIPILCSRRVTLKPGRSVSTTIADRRRLGFSASGLVTANTTT